MCRQTKRRQTKCQMAKSYEMANIIWQKVLNGFIRVKRGTIWRRVDIMKFDILLVDILFGHAKKGQRLDQTVKADGS